jgi:acetolactate synthase-1/2/3 large subunit
MTGAERICLTLEALGVDTVFGLPGSQNVALFEALRTSRLQTIVSMHELGASFMANGYARASGRPGVLMTIPGPGFTYALTGLAEALLDSAPLLHILGAPASAPGRRFQLQALDQRAVAAPLVKRVFDVGVAGQIETTIREAHSVCLAGEPGPVIVQVPASLLAADAADPQSQPGTASIPETPQVDEIERRLRHARRPLLYVGQGAFGAGRELWDLVESLGAAVVTTTSARGILPEDHPRVLCFDRRNTEVLNDLVEGADLVLALGCKFSHNGAHGFRLRLPADRLIHIDTSTEVLGANYEASLILAADVPTVIRALLDRRRVEAESSERGWSDEELRSWRQRSEESTRAGAEPKVRGLRPGSMSDFFSTLRRAMPPKSCLVLDSGLHQMLARRYFPVLCPRGLILPTDLQSMGYALPAAIGAKLARPDVPVVALLGDGGFAMSALELLTAVRERVPLTVIVFNDGHYGLIRKQQLAAYGHAYGTMLLNPDIRGIADSVGVNYLRLEGEAERGLKKAIRGNGVTVIEVLLRYPGRRRLRRVGRGLVSRLKRLLPGRRSHRDPR